VPYVQAGARHVITAPVRRALPFLLLPLAVVLTRLALLNRSVLDWDESLYFLMAQAWRAGHLPYTTIWDNKPLGIYAVFAVFQTLIPGVAALRVAAMACVAGLAVAAFALTRRLGGSGWVAGVAVVVLSLSNDGLASNTELFMALCTTLAVLAVVAEAPAWCVGLALGCGFMIKYVCAPEAALVLALLAHRRGPRALLTALPAAALPLAAAAALYALHGQFGLWVECSLISNFRRAHTALSWTQAAWGIQAQLWRWGPLYALALLLPLRHSWFVPLWLLAALLGALSAKSFYDHYFLEALPPLAVALGLWSQRAGPALAAAALALPLWAGTQALQAALVPDQTAAAGALLAAARPASLYVFDSQPILYSYAGLAPPTRYALPSELVGTTLPQVAGVDPLAEIARVIATRPAIIVRRDPEPAAPNLNPAAYALADSLMAAHYTLWQRLPGLALYRLTPSD